MIVVNRVVELKVDSSLKICDVTFISDTNCYYKKKHFFKVESVVLAARAQRSNLTVKQLTDLAFQKKQESEV